MLNQLNLGDRMPRSRNEWLVYYDHLDNRSRFIVSSRDLELRPSSEPQEIAKRLPIKFRLFDGDGELYFSGRMETADFHPLDEFGIDYGCTELKFYDPSNPITMTYQQL